MSSYEGRFVKIGVVFDALYFENKVGDPQFFPIFNIGNSLYDCNQSMKKICIVSAGECGLKVQSPIHPPGGGVKRQPLGGGVVTMSFYITLSSDQAVGTGQQFTARLPHLHYLVEDEWEAALVHISHPGFNQQLEDQTKQNWTQKDIAKHWMKIDIKYIPKRADGTAPLQVTKQIHLPPVYYHNLKEAWIAIAYEMEKQHMEVMMDIAKMDVDDIAKRKQLAQLNLAQPYVKITNTGVAPELDSLYVLIPANMEFEMEWKLAGLMGLVKDGTPTQRIVQEKNYLVKNIVDYNDRHKWTPTIGPVDKYPPFGHVSVSFTDPEFDYYVFLGPNLSRQPFPTTPTVKPQQGQQQLMIYTDLVIDSVVGNQQKGFLRTVDAGNTDHQFDTRQRMYFPLRKTTFDSIAIDVQTANGQPAPFKQGSTILTLQLSRKSQRT